MINKISEKFRASIQNMIKQKRGITMIALVFTILIVLVVFGIGAYFVVGNNTIIDKGSSAVLESNLAMLKEKLQMKISSWKIDSLSGQIWANKMKEYVAQDTELEMVLYFDNSDNPELSTDATYVKVTFNDYPNYVATVNDKLGVTQVEYIENYGKEKKDGKNIVYLERGQATETSVSANIYFFPAESLQNDVRMYYKIGERIEDWTETTVNNNSIYISYDDITPYIINQDKSITIVGKMENSEGKVIASGELRLQTNSTVEMSDGSPDEEINQTTGTITFTDIKTVNTGSSMKINYFTNTYMSLINCYYKIGTNTTEWVKATSETQQLQIDYSTLDTRAVGANNQVIIYAKMELKSNGNNLATKSQSVIYYSFAQNDSDQFPDGTGTAANPYLIENALQLNAVRNNLGASYKIIKDIDISSYSEWTPIGTSTTPFTGTLDGFGHYIINLNIPNGGDNVGLIGYNTGTIKNVKLNNINITGISNVGGIAGYSSGNIIGTQSIGTINGAVNVGGIVRIYNRKFKWK